MKNCFSININYLKRIKDLDNSDIARLLSVTTATVSKLLNNKTQPSAEALLIISNTYNISIDDLLKKDLRKRPAHIYNVSSELGSVNEEIKRPLGFTPNTGKVYKQKSIIEDTIIDFIKAEVAQQTQQLKHRISILENLINNK